MTNSNAIESKELRFGSIVVTVRELTVLQVRNWLSELTKTPEEFDIVGLAFFAECSFGDLQRMTSLRPEEIDQLRPSELKQVVALCKELNPDFFGFMERLTTAPTPRP